MLPDRAVLFRAILGAWIAALGMGPACAVADLIESATMLGWIKATFYYSDYYDVELRRPGTVSLDVAHSGGGQFVGSMTFAGGKRSLIDIACHASGPSFRYSEFKAGIQYYFRVVRADPDAPLMPVWVTIDAKTEASVTAASGYAPPVATAVVEFRSSPSDSWRLLCSAFASQAKPHSIELFEDSRIVPVGSVASLYLGASGYYLERNPTQRGELQVVADPIIAIDRTQTVLVRGVEVPAYQVYDIEMSDGFLPAYGTPFRWINPVGGSFSVAENWEGPAGPAVPPADADVEFTSLSGGRVFLVTLDQPRTLAGISIVDADVTLELAGHQLDNAGPIFIGQTGPERGLLRLSNGRLTTLGPVRIGTTADVDGVLQIDPGATLDAGTINAGGSGLSGRGTIVLNGGTLRALGVQLQSNRAALNFDSGNMVLDGGFSDFATGSTIVVGNGTDPARLDIVSGSVSFSDGLRLSANATLAFGGGSLRTASLAADPGSTIVWTAGQWAHEAPLTLGPGQPLGEHLLLDAGKGLRAEGGLHLGSSASLSLTGGELFAETLTSDAGAQLQYSSGTLTLNQGDIVVGRPVSGPGGSPVATLANTADSWTAGNWDTPGSLKIEEGYTLRQAAGSIRSTGLLVEGTFDYGGLGVDEAGQGKLELILFGNPLNTIVIGNGPGPAINGRTLAKIGSEGHIHLYGGSLRVDPGFSVNLLPKSNPWEASDPAIYAESISLAGTLRLEEGAYLSAGQLSIEETGTLSGTGIVFGLVVNQGLVSPGSSPGTLEISGDYQQTPEGTLVLEIAGPEQFDSLIVYGGVTAAGTLHIVLRDGYVPGPSDSFPLIKSGWMDGDFEHVLISGGDLLLQMSPGGLVVQGVPEPSTAVLLLLPAALMGMRLVRRRRDDERALGKTDRTTA